MRGWTRRVRAMLVMVAAIGPLAPRPAEAAAARVTLANFRFTPARLEVALGDTVVWEATDGGHTVTARNGAFDSSPRGVMGKGDEFGFRFRVPGAYPYFCRVHQSRGMQGEIVVTDPSAPASTSTTTRPVPTTAAASTAPAGATTTTTTGPPATTTSRPLATSSTTSMSVATATTAPPGAPAEPQEPPALNPAARLVGSPVPNANLSEAQAAARRSKNSGVDPAAAAGLGLLVALAAAGGGALLRSRRRRTA